MNKIKVVLVEKFDHVEEDIEYIFNTPMTSIKFQNKGDLFLNVSNMIINQKLEWTYGADDRCDNFDIFNDIFEISAIV